MKRKKYVVLFLVLSVIALLSLVLIRQATPSVSCVPNEDNSAVQITVKNAKIGEITLKYNNGILQTEQGSQLLSIHGEGVEYVRVYYTNRKNIQRFVDFEIVISQYNTVSITKFNSVGQQVDYNAY